MQNHTTQIAKYLDILQVKEIELTPTIIRKVFDMAVADYIRHLLPENVLSDIASDLLYGFKLCDEIHGEDNELAYILTFTAELNWDIENNKPRHKNTLKKIVNWFSPSPQK